MKQTDFRDVPDELWERIEPLLASFKRNGSSRPLPQRTVLAGILYKCRSGCQWAMLPACYGSKSTVHEHFPGSWQRFFAYFSPSMERRLASMPNGKPWTAPCCKPRRALKKSATEGLGRNPTDRGRSGGKIHLHADGQGIPFAPSGKHAVICVPAIQFLVHCVRHRRDMYGHDFKAGGAHHRNGLFPAHLQRLHSAVQVKHRALSAMLRPQPRPP